MNLQHLPIFVCGILYLGLVGAVPPRMTLHNTHPWGIAAGLAAIAILGAVALWLALRKRPTAEEVERARRQFLVKSGRLVDGMLLDIFEVDAPANKPNEDSRTLTMLLFSYRIGGVDYECSQDITDLGAVLDPATVRAGFPCTVRSQPGNPQNSIVVAEEWSGLRMGLPVLPGHNDA
jgi:hypothetical protein